MTAALNEREYLLLLQSVLDHGVHRKDRTGVGTLGLFGAQMRFDLRDGFPLLTTKKIHTKSVVGELLWFLSGSMHVADLQERGVKIWDEWATPEQCARFGREPGDLGPIYGHQWRNFGSYKDSENSYSRHGGVDQIQRVLDLIRKDPDSRRMIVSAWNPKEADQVALPPCHTLFQFYVQNGELSCHLYQRSADIFLGLPFNIASYALLTCLIAHVTDLKPGSLIHSLGDVHLYKNHVYQAQLQLTRMVMQPPQLLLTPSDKDLFSIKEENIHFVDYNPHPAIKAPVAV